MKSRPALYAAAAAVVVLFCVVVWEILTLGPAVLR